MKALLISLLSCISILLWGQKDYVLETRFRNPIDTAAFSKNPTMLIFVHSQCKEGHMCPTLKMQKALESDSLGFRNKYGIKLYVVYREYSKADVNTFDSFAQKNATVAFYTSRKYEGTFSEKSVTPYIVFYDGRGHIHKKEGGTIEELQDSINSNWSLFVNEVNNQAQYDICICKGTGRCQICYYDRDYYLHHCSSCNNTRICSVCKGAKYRVKRTYGIKK